MPPSGGLTEDNAGVVFSFPCRPDTIPGQRGRSQRYSAFFVFFPTDRRRRTLAYFEPSAQNRLYGPSEGLTDARSPEADRGRGIRFSLRRRHRPYPVIFDADFLARPHRIRNDTGQPTSGSRGNTDPSPPVMWGPREQRGGLSRGLDTFRCEEGASSPLTVHVPLSFV